MALGDTIPNDDDDEENSSGSQRKYVRPDKEDFSDCLKNTGHNWTVVDDHDSGEFIVETGDIMEHEHDVTLRVFTTLDKRTGKARDKGSDAIRTVLWSKKLDRPIGGRTKTLRIKTWCKNLTEKIESITDEVKDYVNICDECGGFMVKRSGEYGDFLGCNGYPDCDNTRQMDD